MPSCYTETKPTARKRHRCCECLGWIEPGEKYQLITGVWDSHGQSFKTCLQCDALRDRIRKITDCCIALGQMRSGLVDSDVYYGNADRWKDIWEDHNAIRIRRGAAISPAFKEEENELQEVLA